MSKPHNEFAKRLSNLTDEELVAAFNQEARIGNSTWTSSRGSYLAAMRNEFKIRKFECDEFENGYGFLLKPAKLVTRKILIRDDEETNNGG